MERGVPCVLTRVGTEHEQKEVSVGRFGEADLSSVVPLLPGVCTHQRTRVVQ